MSKLRYFKIIYIIILLLLIFCVNFKTAYAFFSPSTLQLLSASLGTLGQVLVVLITAIISFGIKLKRGKIKRIIFITLFSSLFICVAVVGWRFYRLRKINSMLFDNNVNIDLIYFPEVVDYSDKFIDLSQINKSQYNEFKKIRLVDKRFQLIDTALLTSIFQLKELMLDDKIENFLTSHGINKKDKLLLYCNAGATSIPSAYLLNKLGYDAYYTNLNQLKNKDYLEFNRFPLNETDLPIIVPLKEGGHDKKYIFFMFHRIENEYCHPEIYPTNIKNKLKKIVVWPEETYKEFQCKVPKAEFNEIFDEHSKMVCLSKIDCILTQHYLDYLNLADKFKRVFFIE